MAGVALVCTGAAESSQKFDQPAAGARSPRNASYDIDVTLEPGDRSLHGRERIHWRNISANPTSELQFHLYWNAFRNAESTWLRERRLGGNTNTPRPDAWGWTDIRSLRVIMPDRIDVLTPLLHYIAPDDGNTADKTVAAVPLPHPVAPERSDRHRDRMEREDSAAILAHRLHRRLLLLRPVVSQARRARRHGLEHTPVPFGDGVLLRLRRRTTFA